MTYRASWYRMLTIAVVLTAVTWGCNEQLKGPDGQPTTEQAIVTEAKTAIDNAKAEVAALEKKAEVEPLSPDEAATLARTKAVLAQMEQIMGQITTDANTIDPHGTVGAIANYIPPPFNILFSVIAGAGAEWWRTRKGRASFAKLVQLLQKRKQQPDSPLADEFKAMEPEIKETLGPKGVAILDKVRKGEKVRPLGIPAF